jgi:hypothetical protein
MSALPPTLARANKRYWRRSAYNTGTFDRGFANGYVARVAGIPAIADLSIPAKAAHPPNPYTATTVAYSREELHVRIE